MFKGNTYIILGFLLLLVLAATVSTFLPKNSKTTPNSAIKTHEKK